jgi:hypothetical protein
MKQYRIRYVRQDMPEGYVSSVVKYARDDKEALKHLGGSKPDKNGFFRMKRGGVAQIKSIEIESN